MHEALGEPLRHRAHQERRGRDRPPPPPCVAVAGQRRRPSGRGAGEFGQDHPRREPRRERRRQDLVVEPVVQSQLVPRHERPSQARHPRDRDRRDAPPRRPPAQPRERPPQQRQHQIEAHLHGQRPRVREPLDEGVRDVHLGERQVGRPCAGGAPCVPGDEQEHRGHQDEIRGHDADESGAQIVAGGPCGPRASPACVQGVRAPQQETREREEHGHGQVEAAPDAVEERPRRGPGLERDMGGEYSERGDRPEPLERRHEARRGGQSPDSVVGGAKCVLHHC